MFGRSGSVPLTPRPETAGVDMGIAVNALEGKLAPVAAAAPRLC